jgi:hypothetical protein
MVSPDIPQALYNHSPGMCEHKREDFQNYIDSTVDQAMRDPEVIQAREKAAERALERDMDRGLGLSM